MGAGCGCASRRSNALETYSYSPTFANAVFPSRMVELAIKQLGLFYDSERVYICRQLVPYYEKVLDRRYQLEATFVMEFARIGKTGVDHLSKLIPFYAHIREFRLCKSDVSLEPLFPALKPLASLERLSLEDNGINGESFCALVREFQHWKRLEELWLAANSLNFTDAKVLTVALDHFPRLHTLSLSDNSIGTDGCYYLCKKLETRKPLKMLILQANSLDSEAVPALLSLANTNPPLDMTDLSRNAFSAADCESLIAAFGSEVINVTNQN